MVVENLVDFDMTDKTAVARRCVIDFEYLPDVRAIGLTQAGHCAARIHTDDLAAHEQAMADTLCEERRAAKEQKANSSTDACLLYTSPSPRDRQKSRMPSSA